MWVYNIKMIHTIFFTKIFDRVLAMLRLMTCVGIVSARISTNQEEGVRREPLLCLARLSLVT